MTWLLSLLPDWLKQFLRKAKRGLLLLPYLGTGRHCPVCGKSSSRFRTFGAIPRKDAKCPHCGALERHRLLWHFLRERTSLFDGNPKTMLHVAPEPCLESRLRSALGDQYLTADLFNPRAMVKMDITDIKYSDESFDVIYCSHVLEHVLDDAKAMREFHRVLKADGWAILLVPITSEKTFEDASVVSPEERLRVFGQEDHVRRYGPDYVDRLRSAGFGVDVFETSDLVDACDAERMGLTKASGRIYFCTK